MIVGAGPNFSNVLLKDFEKYDYCKYDFKSIIGIDARIGISFPLTKKMNSITFLKYSQIGNSFHFDKYVGPDDFAIDSTIWIINSEMTNRGIGVSSGIELSFLKKISLSVLFSYKRNIDEKLKNHVTTNISVFKSEFEETINTKKPDEFSSSIEASYLFTKKIKFIVGTEFTFNKMEFFPTKKYSDEFHFKGFRYRYFVLFEYIF